MSAPFDGEEAPEDEPANTGSKTGTESGNDTSTTTPTDTTTTPGTETPVTPPPKPKSAMTFFVTSTAGATGGNLGGLDGADKRCQDAAAAVEGGDHTWHAYLSITGTNAKDRIGPGPWQNQKGVVIATTLDKLHSTTNIVKSPMILDEKGAAVPPAARRPLTGTRLDGTATANNCDNWTNATNQKSSTLGDADPDTNPNLGGAWNFSKTQNQTATCNAAALKAAGSEARLYCFAID